MSAIFVAGLINIETTVQVDNFTIHYSPVRFHFFGVNSSVSGVGYNVAKALARLGDRVELASLVGQDATARLVREALIQDGIPDGLVLESVPYTAQSAIFYEKSGRRMINVDLKDIQERAYPLEKARPALANSDLAVLCNINFSRLLLAEARSMGKPIAMDVHTIVDLEDDYNRDYMATAAVLFMSDERLPCSPEEWARRVLARYGCDILVIGLGKQGALLAVRGEGFIGRFPAVTTRPVVNSIGAGDAMFSSFIHFYVKTKDAQTSMTRAMVFASYKIGSVSAAEGFLNEDDLISLVQG
jgi:sugar/nucleoside kinase (ribokinase family)